jgi:hypothetical protein
MIWRIYTLISLMHSLFVLKWWTQLASFNRYVEPNYIVSILSNVSGFLGLLVLNFGWDSPYIFGCQICIGSMGADSHW